MCGVEIELHYCCDGYMCGCQGLPTDPPVCSEKCQELYKIDLVQKQKLIAINLTYPHINIPPIQPPTKINNNLKEEYEQ